MFDWHSGTAHNPAAHLKEEEEDVRRAIICQTFTLHHCAQFTAGTNLHQQVASVAASRLSADSTTLSTLEALFQKQACQTTAWAAAGPMNQQEWL